MNDIKSNIPIILEDLLSKKYNLTKYFELCIHTYNNPYGTDSENIGTIDDYKNIKRRSVKIDV